MNPSIQWEGNIRELQALSREIFNVAIEDFQEQRKRHQKEGKKRNSSGGADAAALAKMIKFRGTHVRRAQQNLQRKLQPVSEKLVHPA
jgi:hypothetical protein